MSSRSSARSPRRPFPLLYATAQFDSAFRLTRWSMDFARLLELDPASLQIGAPFHDLLIARRGPDGTLRPLTQYGGKLRLATIRGETGGELLTALPSGRLIDTTIAPQQDGGFKTSHFDASPPEEAPETESDAPAAPSADAAPPPVDAPPPPPPRKGSVQALIDAVPICLFFIDDGFTIRACNRELEMFVGRPRAELVGAGLDSLLPPALMEELRLYAADMPEEGSRLQFDREIPDGRSRGRIMRITLARLDPTPGAPEGTLVTLHDLTDVKRAERASRRAAENMRRILDASPSAVAILRAEDGVILYANHRVARLFGEKLPEAFVGEDGDTLLLQGALKHIVADVKRNGKLRDFPGAIRLPNGLSRELLTTIDMIDFVDSPSLLWWGYDVTRLHGAHAAMTRMAMHDKLTGLPNRASFEEEFRNAVDSARRTGRGHALMYFDLDGFKAVNDGYGHDAGDFVLVEAARRMTDALRSSDFLARLGGDEFSAILRGVTLESDLAAICTKINQSVRAPYPWRGQELMIGVSIGVVVAYGAHEDSAELKRLADQAMYDAKRAGKNTYRIRYEAAPPQAEG